MSFLNHSGYIFLYNGQGANPYCVEKAKSSFLEYLGQENAPRLIAVDSSYIVRDLSSSGKAVVFTGGNACSIYDDFKVAGIKSLSEAILNHGRTYIGFCSGNYLAGQFIYHYDHECLTSNYGLNLIDLQYIGPAFPLEKEAKHLGVNTSKAAKINFGPDPLKTCYVYWNGGGSYEFYDPLSTIKVASYAEQEFNRFGNIAGLCDLNKGHGKVICTSIHPEIQLDSNEVQLWGPLMTENEKEQLVNDAPLQKECLAEICNLVDLKDQNRNDWKRYNYT